MIDLLRNGLLDGRLVDVTINAGRITAIDPTGASNEPGPQQKMLDLQGRVLIPPLVNGHAHLDKTFWGLPWRPNEAGPSVRERAVYERRIRQTEPSPQAPRSSALARQMGRAGVGLVRSHVDIDTTVGLSGLEAVLQARADVQDLMDLQIVAFPQSGILADPGVADLMHAAMASGADVVGGLDPLGFDGDQSGHLDVVFGLAEKYAAPIDIHLHDLGEQGLAQIRDICARTLALGLQGRVAVSHAYALGSAAIGATTESRVAETAESLAASGVAVMTDGPVGYPPPVELLRSLGVRVFSGSDGIRDAWTPYGVPQMMPIARQLAYQNRIRTDPGLESVSEIVTTAGAKALGVDHAIAVGRRADLVVLDARTLAEAVASAAPPVLILRSGKPVPLAERVDLSIDTIEGSLD